MTPWSVVFAIRRHGLRANVANAVDANFDVVHTLWNLGTDFWRQLVDIHSHAVVGAGAFEADAAQPISAAKARPEPIFRLSGFRTRRHELSIRRSATGRE